MENAIIERYKLQEAARILARGDTEDAGGKLLRALRKSIRDGNLKAYRPGSNVHYELGVDGESFAIKESDLIRLDSDILAGGFTWVDKVYDDRLNEALHQVPDDLEVYWKDLNTWLEENEPRLGYRFPNPDISAAIQVEKQISGMSTSEQSTDKEKHDITRERGCRRLILENWDKIKLLHGDNADGWQVLKVLKTHIDEDERVPKLKTVQNRLIELRKEKLIP